MINLNGQKFKKFANKLVKKIENQNSFENLLKVLLNAGVSEDIACKMIMNVVDEEIGFREIQNNLVDIYQDAKEILINNGREFKA